MVVKQNSQSSLAAYKVSVPSSNHQRAMRRSDRKPLWVMIHLAVCCGGDSNGAENLASYSTKPGIGVSWHYNTDKDSIVQSLDERWPAWHCGSATGNERAFAVEMAVYQRPVDVWLDKSGDYYKTMVNTARITADLCDRWGIPKQLVLDKGGLGSMKPGITSHLAVNRSSNPWGDSKSNHVDPDPFPWDVFMGLVNSGDVAPVEPEVDVLDPGFVFMQSWSVIEGFFVEAHGRRPSFGEVLGFLCGVSRWDSASVASVRAEVEAFDA